MLCSGGEVETYPLRLGLVSHSRPADKWVKFPKKGPGPGKVVGYGVCVIWEIKRIATQSRA